MCIQPDETKATCTSGQRCSLNLTGRLLQAGHVLAIRPLPRGPLLPSRASLDGTSYRWEEPLSLGGGVFKLLWCPGLHGACAGAGDFLLEVGELRLLGPFAGPEMRCVRGRACEGLGPVRGEGLTGSDRVEVQRRCGAGPTVHLAEGAESGVNVSDGQLHFGFGPEPVTVEPSAEYKICWCTVGLGRACASDQDFGTSFGTLVVEGPKQGQEVLCHLGQHCIVAGITGVGMAVGDRLMVLDRCGAKGSAIPDMPGEAIVETRDRSNFAFLVGNETAEATLSSGPGFFRLCFCRALDDSMSCSTPADFVADVGLLTAIGPYSDHEKGCFLGAPCTVSGLRGIGLEDRNEVLIQSQPCGEVSEAAVGFPSTPTTPRAGKGGGEFYLGVVQNVAKPGRYHICWRPGHSGASSTFGASMGHLSLACPAGTFRFLDSCQECPLAHFCPGGTAAGGYSDDAKSRCRYAGETTLSKGSRSQEECLCGPGMAKGISSCELCAPGRFKSTVSNNIVCPEACPNGTNSLAGASSQSHCYDTGSLSQQGLDAAQVFVLEGSLELGALGCMDVSEQERAVGLLWRALARLLAVRESEVSVEYERPADCPAAAGGRRLEARGLQVSFKLQRASQEEVERLRQSLHLPELELQMPRDIAVLLREETMSVSVEQLRCPENMAFPPGSRPTSRAECGCSPGYSREGRACSACGLGAFKDAVGDGACSPCPLQALGESSVRLTTLLPGARGVDECTCPPGYYLEATSVCQSCPLGHYCTGGAEVTACPEGSTTIAQRSSAVDQCVCGKGHYPSAMRNATHRCRPCPGGFFKVAVDDGDCAQACPAHSTSDVGAETPLDCYCEPGYFYDVALRSCQACQADGVHCPGGFEPPGSRLHAEPSSLPGFYMTGFSAAEQCNIKDITGSSVCLGGARFGNDTGSCSGSQDGPLCGACQRLTVRDLGDMPCVPCIEGHSDAMYVGSLLGDLVLKACFGIFLGRQALEDGGRKRMDAIVMRILLQWVAAASVLQTLHLPGVDIFEWSKEAMEKAAEASSVMDGSNPSSVTGAATGLSFKFNFPEEFQPVWTIMMSVRGSIPSFRSPQESIECLVQRNIEPTEQPQLLQLMVPAIWWLVYPLLVLFTVYLLCLLVAKVGWPVMQRLTGWAQRKLTKALLAAGVSPNTAAKAVGQLDERRVYEILEDPSTVSSVQGLLDFLGVDVMAEAIAAFLAKHSTEHVAKILQTWLDEDADESLQPAVKAVLAADNDELYYFLVTVIKLLEPSEFAGAVTGNLLVPKLDPHLISGVLPPFLRRLDPQKLLKALEGDVELPVRGISQSSFRTTSSGGGFRDRPSMNSAGVRHHSSLVSARRELEEPVIFGLFRSSNAGTVFVDAHPLFLVTLYSTWDLTTRRMLGLVQMKRILLTVSMSETGRELQQLQGRWLYDMRFQVFKGPHLFVGLVACFGLAIWSIGFLMALCLKLHRNKHALHEPAVLKSYGYFYNGLQPRAYWWDIVAKKFDILCLYTVTFTMIFPDPKAKLIMYLGLAGVCWAAHYMYRPFEARQNMLADRLEGLGLAVRFLTLFLFQCLLIVNANRIINSVAACFVVVTNLGFMALCCFLLLVEIPNTGEETGKNDDDALQTTEKAATKAGQAVIAKAFGRAGRSNPLLKLIAQAASCLLGRLIRPLLSVLMKMAEGLTAVQRKVAREVPHLVWLGPGEHYLLTTREREDRQTHCRLLAFIMRIIYKLGEEDQRSFLASIVGRFLDHLITNSKCNTLPNHILDVFFALPTALAAERLEEVEGSPPIHLRVAKRIRSMLGQGPPGLRKPLTREALTHRRTSRYTKELEMAFTPEDLNTALLFVQSLPAHDVRELLEKACQPQVHELPSEGFWQPGDPVPAEDGFFQEGGDFEDKPSEHELPSSYPDSEEALHSSWHMSL